MGEQVYSYLADRIEPLDHQVCLLRNAAWRKQQSAAGLAMRHRVLVDKTARLLAAFQPRANVDEH